MQTAVSVAVGVALHFVAVFAGGFVVHVSGKPAAHLSWLVGAFWIPFATSGLLLGLVNGVTSPRRNAGISAVIVSSIFCLGSRDMVFTLGAVVPGVVLSMCGAAFGFHLSGASIPGRPRFRWQRYAWISALLLIIFIPLFLITGELGTARNARARVLCDRNLAHFFAALEEYHDEHGQLPANKDGGLDWGVVVRDLERLSSEFYPCRGVFGFEECYLTNPSLKTRNLAAANETLPEVLVADRPGNHPIRRANGLRKKENGLFQEQANLLLSNGRVVTWDGDAVAYKEWSEQFISGNGIPYPPGIQERLLDD